MQMSRSALTTVSTYHQDARARTQTRKEVHAFFHLFSLRATAVPTGVPSRCAGEGRSRTRPCAPTAHQRARVRSRPPPHGHSRRSRSRLHRGRGLAWVHPLCCLHLRRPSHRRCSTILCPKMRRMRIHSRQRCSSRDKHVILARSCILRLQCIYSRRCWKQIIRLKESI